MEKWYPKSYLLLSSLLSGFLELGGIFSGITQHLSILEVIGIGLAYQIGNMVPNPIQLSRRLVFISAWSGLFCFLLMSFIGFHYSLFFVGYILLASTLQALHSIQTHQLPKTMKRTCRILGFLLAPLLTINIIFAVMIFLCMIIMFTHFPIQDRCMVIRSSRLTSIHWIMIIHQAHYFCYVYFLIFIMSKYIGISLLGTSIVFALGWLSYISVERMLRGTSYIVYFVIGHFWLAIVFLLLSLNVYSYLTVVLWILTGFGSGTVFCITKLYNKDYRISKISITYAENIGHILGVSAGILIYFFFQNMHIVMLQAAVLAAMAIVSMFIYRRSQLIQRW